MAFEIDWDKVDNPDPKDVCPQEDCGHRVNHLGFTPRHKWSLDCRAGMWWKGCNAFGATDGCECRGCAPRRTTHTRKLDANLTRRCSCARRYPERARAEAEYQQERIDDDRQQ